MRTHLHTARIAGTIACYTKHVVDIVGAVFVIIILSQVVGQSSCYDRLGPG